MKLDPLQVIRLQMEQMKLASEKAESSNDGNLSYLNFSRKLTGYDCWPRIWRPQLCFFDIILYVLTPKLRGEVMLTEFCRLMFCFSAQSGRLLTWIKELSRNSEPVDETSKEEIPGRSLEEAFPEALDDFVQSFWGSRATSI